MTTLFESLRQTVQRAPYDGCPLCGGKLAALRSDSCRRHHCWRAGLPEQIDWVTCEACQHICTSGYFAGDELFGEAQLSQTPGYDVEQGRLRAARTVERVLSARNGATGRWLDVGFGAGHLLTTAEEYGFRVTGIDVRETPVTTLDSLGYDVRRIAFDDMPEEPFDVVSMADVLEHLPFPRAALEKARRIIPDGGALMVSAPNARCFAWRALTIAKQNPYWGELEHYHNFTRDRLERLLVEMGFRPVSYSVSERYRVGMEIVAVAG